MRWLILMGGLDPSGKSHQYNIQNYIDNLDLKFLWAFVIALVKLTPVSRARHIQLARSCVERH
ncbi:protein of unknown function [Pseudodesulfovibrio profundus]|uniref:Uncharacterized protein n=1 Tax=Pseudodesulfovibrio profundus TaxID=57320 RepID=A0A2C8F3C1_9BACT|nr:protein of unknown function [Pseudodesulfovibrio profundus]